MSHRFVQRALGATLVVLVTACTGGSTRADLGDPATRAGSTSGLPAIFSSGAMRNVSFYYTGTEELTAANVEALKKAIGHPGIVVTTPRASSAAETDAVNAIHGLSPGTKAYRYVNFYWAPVSEATHEGVPLNSDLNWAFCAQGNNPVVGRKTPENWYFLDLNEKAVLKAIKARLIELKAQGWDGVMFDRGMAATQNAPDINGNRLWAKKSSCTQDKAKVGATFSDAFVHMVGLAKGTGLAVMMNNGRSPFDVKIQMRPNPRNAACRAARWSACKFLDDVWPKVDLVLNETPAHPRGEDWGPDFRANQRSERSTAHGHRTVALITTATLGGEAQQTKKNVYYQWSRIKLFNLAVAVNTGTGGCPDGGTESGVCNRFGVYPELANVTFGKPLRAGPAKQSCLKNSSQSCVWTRTYARGANVLNQTGTTKRVTIDLGVNTCRHVKNLRTGTTVAGCVKRVKLTLPPWSGTPLLYS